MLSYRYYIRYIPAVLDTGTAPAASNLPVKIRYSGMFRYLPVSCLRES